MKRSYASASTAKRTESTLRHSERRKSRRTLSVREQLHAGGRPEQHLVLAEGFACGLGSRVASTLWR